MLGYAIKTTKRKEKKQEKEIEFTTVYGTLIIR